MFWYEEITGDLFLQNKPIAITTNGYVTKDGRCVMGRGCALEAKNRFKGIDREIGFLIKKYGNVPFPLRYDDSKLFKFVDVFTFPVKHVWNEKADINLIRQSMYLLNVSVKASGLEEIVIPRPGCGNGQLEWDYVKSELTKLELPYGYDIKHYFITNEEING